MVDRKIKLNKIQCNTCKDILISHHRHDFKYCTCGKVAVDGGKAYLRRVFGKGGDYTDLSEYEKSKEEETKEAIERALAVMKIKDKWGSMFFGHDHWTATYQCPSYYAFSGQEISVSEVGSGCLGFGESVIERLEVARWEINDNYDHLIKQIKDIYG